MKLAVIRIAGKIGIRKDIAETLDRLRLRKKYVCVLIEDTAENLGMLKKIRDFVAYGNINSETEKELIAKRGRKDSDGKLKPFFRLHPPRGGIDSKKHFGVKKGVLGNHGDEINKLILRML